MQKKNSKQKCKIQDASTPWEDGQKWIIFLTLIFYFHPVTSPAARWIMMDGKDDDDNDKVIKVK